MAEHSEVAEVRGDLVLQALDLVVFELEDQAALHADQVIVVFSDDLVARLAVAELALDGDAAVHEQLERAVHGGVADARVALADLREELVDRDVLARAQEQLDDRLALGGDVEAAVLDILPPALLELDGVVGPEVLTLAHARQLPRKQPGRQGYRARRLFNFEAVRYRARA